MSKKRKWIYWIASALVLMGAVAAIIMVTLPQQEVISAAKFKKSVRLTELSEDDCVKFVNSYEINIPSDLKGPGLGGFIKEKIVQFETEPYSPVVNDYSVAVKFTEAIRKAVNEHYNVPDLEMGSYEFDECLYMTPISSYYPFEGTGEQYNINSDFFMIANRENPDASIRKFISFWAVQSVDLDAWDAKFQFMEPFDISGYTHRACYPVNERYEIYLMDGEVWLATLNGANTFWSIYKLKLAQ